jgi:hypothetical protein
VKYRASHDGNTQSPNPNRGRQDPQREPTHFSLKPSWMQQEGFEQLLRKLLPQQASAASTSPASQTKIPQLRSVTDSTPYTEVYTQLSSQTESASNYLSPCTSRQSSAQSNKYKCGLGNCPFESDTPGQVKKHRKSSHTPKKDWPNKCNICGETTLEPGHLVRHRREVHDKVIVGRCSKCGTTDTRKWNLARHEIICDGSKPPSTKPRRQRSSTKTSASSPKSYDDRAAECHPMELIDRPMELIDYSHSSSSTSNADSNGYGCLQSRTSSTFSPGTVPTSTPGPARLGQSKQ